MHDLITTMRAWIAPEIRLFPTWDDAKKAWKTAQWDSFRTRRGFLALVAGVVAMTAIMLWILPMLPKSFIAPLIIFVVLASVGASVNGFFAAPEVQKSLRRQLNELNIRVCNECGFDLRESLDLGRCPECGTKFSNDSIRHHSE